MTPTISSTVSNLILKHQVTFLVSFGVLHHYQKTPEYLRVQKIDACPSSPNARIFSQYLRFPFKVLSEIGKLAFKLQMPPLMKIHTLISAASTSINLQKDCADVVFVDVPSNAQSTRQAARRVIRIGQKHACRVMERFATKRGPVTSEEGTLDEVFVFNVFNAPQASTDKGGDFEEDEFHIGRIVGKQVGKGKPRHLFK